jgi:hypothetical protein
MLYIALWFGLCVVAVALVSLASKDRVISPEQERQDLAEQEAALRKG